MLRESSALMLTLYAISFGQLTDLLLDFKNDNPGQTVMGFLALPTDAAQMASGEASFAGAGTAADMVTFPSATATFYNPRVTLTHTEHVLGLRKEFAGVCFPVQSVGTIGLYSTFFSTGRWADSRSIDEERVRPRAFDFAEGLSFSRAFVHESLAAGLSLSYAESHLDEASARGIVVGADIRYAPVNWVSVRAGADNIGPPVSYGVLDEMLPLRAGASLRFTPLAQSINLRNRFAFAISAGAVTSAGSSMKLGGGTELRILDMIAIRAGYDYSLDGREPLEGISAGGGVRIGPYNVAFGWKNRSQDLGGTWALSATYSGEEILAKTAQDYYTVAEKHFRKKHYKRAIYYAREAIALDPNLWQAHTLITRANAAMMRKEGLEIAFVYAGGLDGAFLSATGTSATMGGLARQATVVNQIRRRFPVSFAVCTGNLIRGSSHPIKIKLAGAFLDSMRFDGVSAGTGEINAGIETFLASCRKGDVVISTMPRPPDRRLVSATLMQKNGYTLALLSAIQRDSLQSPDIAAQFAEPVREIRQHLESLPLKIANIRIMTVYGSWEFVKHLAREFPQIDIIICGSLAQRFESPMRIDSTWVLSTGALGQYVGNCLMRFNPQKKLLSLDNRLIPLTGSVVPDSAINELVQQTTLKVELAQAGIDGTRLKKGDVDGVFCFLSNRSGTPNLYLKVIDQHAEFPLSQSDYPCSNPVFCKATGSILYSIQVNDTLPPSWFFMYADGSGKRPVTTDKGITMDARFSYDGVWIYQTVKLADGTTDIVRTSTTTSVQETIVGWEGSSEGEPAFSPDGVHMAFVSDRDKKRQVYLSNIQAENPLAISPLAGNHFGPSFSADGRFIAHLTDRTGSLDQYDLWVYNRTTGRQLQITRNAHIADYIWAGDSETLLYSTGVNLCDYNTIQVVTGETSKLITTQGMKDWDEQGALVVPYKGVNRFVYTKNDEKTGRTICIVNTDGTSEITLIDGPGDDWTR